MALGRIQRLVAPVQDDRLAAHWRVILLTVGLGAFVIRLPFAFAGIGMDEGGYAYVAQQWAAGVQLYSDGAWVDRPQGLLVMYRAILLVSDQPGAIRVAAALAGAAIAFMLVLIGTSLASRQVGVAAGVVYAVIGVSPRAEGFTLNAELAAALPATFAVFLVCRWLAKPSWSPLLAAGVVAGCAVTVKQSAFDGIIVLIVVAAISPSPFRRRLGNVAIAMVGIIVPIGVALLHGATLGWSRYWWSIVGYRLAAPSGGGATPHTRWLALQLLLQHVRPELLVPTLVAGVGLVVVIAWRRLPQSAIPIVWMAAALIGANIGGLYWAHYVVQVLPPLAVLCGAAIAASRRAWLVGIAIAVLPVLLSLAHLAAGPASMRAHTIAYDGRSTNDARIAEMIDHCVPASGTILALPAEADLPFLADRREAYPYLWGHEITEIHGAQQRLVQTIAAHPALVAIYPDDPWLVQSAAVETALHGEHQVAVVGGVRLLAPSGPSACWREALRFRR